MAHDFDQIELDEGSGGAKVAGDEYTDGADTAFMPVSTLALPDGSGGFVQVGESGQALPVDGPLTDDELRASAVPVDGSGVTQPVSAAALPLPSGAATSAKQDTGNVSLASIDTKITAVNTGAVVVSSSALPSGAATSANQSTGNTSVGNVDTNLGAKADSSASSDTGTFSLIALFKRLLEKITAGLTVSGTVTANAGTGPFPVSDNGGALTVDNGGTFAVQVSSALPVGTNAIGKLAANDGVDIGNVDVASVAAGDNNIGNVDIETFPSTVHSADFDSGGGTDTTLAFGIAVPASGGAAVITGDAGNGLDVDVTRVSGTVTVDGSGVTQPVSHAALTELAAAIDTEVQCDIVSSALPSGASTSTKQDTIIGHVDGIETVLGTIDADTSALAGAVAGSELQVDIVSSAAIPVTDNAGSLTVDAPVGTPAFVRLSDGSSAIATLPVSLVTVPSHAVTNAGTFATQVDGSALTALQKIDDPVLVDDAGFTPGTSSVAMAGFQADESSTDSVDEGDAGAARMTLDRKVIVTTQPHTAGGLSVFKSTDIDETEEDVKTSAGQVYAIYCVNTNASARFLKLYNATAANTTVGSTATVMDLLVPPSNSGFYLQFPNGVAFSTAICVAATTGVGDSDTGAPGGSEVQVHVFYK